MNASRLMPKLVFGSSTLLTLAAVCVRSAALFHHFDADIGYYDGSALSTAGRWIYAGLLLPVLLAFFIPKDTLPTRLGYGKRSLPAAMPLFASLVFAISLLTSRPWTSGKLMIPLTVFAILTAAFFLLLLLDVKNRQVTAGIAFFPVIFAMLGIAQTYTDPFVTMNSPVKLSIQFGLVGFMLAMTGEIRYLLDRALPRVFLCLHALSMFLCLTASVPYLVGWSKGTLSNGMYALYALFLLGYGLFSLVRLCQFLTLPEPVDEQPEAAGASDEAAEEVSAATGEEPEGSSPEPDKPDEPAEAGHADSASE